MFNKLRSSKGFTLIELLIVVAIIGILAAIAIPQFSKYRIQGFNASANSDMRNIRTSEESLYAEWQRYGKTDNATAMPGAGGFGVGALVTGPGVAATPNLITTTDNVGTFRGLQIPVGNNVNAVATTSATPGASYSVATKHLQGDTMFAGTSESTANYKLPWDGTLGKNAGTPLVAADAIAPVVGTDGFGAAAGIALGWKSI